MVRQNHGFHVWSPPNTEILVSDQTELPDAADLFQPARGHLQPARHKRQRKPVKYDFNWRIWSGFRTPGP